MACDGVGPSYTCTMLLQGMQAAGLRGRVYVNRVRQRVPGLDYVPALHWPMNQLPYRLLAGRTSQRTGRRFLADLAPGDIAYLWPAAPLWIYREVRARGNPIIAEGINTRMAHARRILDEAYRVEGLVPAHGITDARIAEEEAKLALTTAIFAPSAGVEDSLRGSWLDPGGILRASYGVTLPLSRPTRRPGARPVFLFVGQGSIRKGLHNLLRAWARAQTGGTLLLAGTIEPAVRSLCADLLGRLDVRALGFVRDVQSLYAQADVFVLPSFEEGDPLVTYEAAAQGLPIIASAMGGGRIGQDRGCVLPVDPVYPDAIAAALARMADSPAEREAWGDRSFAAVGDYSWAKVAARRANLLQSLVMH